MAETPTGKQVGSESFNKDVMDDYQTEAGKRDVEIDFKPDYTDPRWKVSSAGLVWEADSQEKGQVKFVEKDGTETLIDMKVDIGESGKGKILVACESGIEQFVRELADDETNHLPSSKTGVVIHYLVEGIARDFQTTFSAIPTSLSTGRARRGGRDAGKIPITKSEKNELIQRLDISFYEEDIRTGRISFEDALEQIKVAFDKKKSWQRIVNDAYEHIPSVTGSASYIMNKLEVILPNIFTNFFEDGFKHANRKMTLEMAKSVMKTASLDPMMKYKVGGITPQKDLPEGAGGLAQSQYVNTQDDIIDLLGHKQKGQLMGIHLVKNKRPGMSKPRNVLSDEYLDGKQTLSLYGPNRDTTRFTN